MVLERPTLLNAQEPFQLPVHITLVAGILVNGKSINGGSQATGRTNREPQVFHDIEVS